MASSHAILPNTPLPAFVETDIYSILRSHSPFFVTQLYAMDVYFRQAWYDKRLGFSLPNMDELTMSWLFLDKIWKPDTFFLNGKKSHLHRMTSPNKFVRLRKDGFLTYSMRWATTIYVILYSLRWYGP